MFRDGVLEQLHFGWCASGGAVVTGYAINRRAVGWSRAGTVACKFSLGMLLVFFLRAPMLFLFNPFLTCRVCCMTVAAFSQLDVRFLFPTSRSLLKIVGVLALFVCGRASRVLWRWWGDCFS